MKRIVVIGIMMIGAALHGGCYPEGTPIWTIANAACSTVDAIESKIDALVSCNAQAIDQNDLLISTSGIYCLMQDVVGTVTIASSYVYLDLNGHVISGGLNGVVLQAGLHDVSVANGVIQNAEQEGILIPGESSRIQLNDLTVIGCAQTDDRFAIDFVGTLNERITGCTVSGVTISQASNGLRIVNGDNNSIQGVRIDTILNTTNATGIFLEGDSSRNALGNHIAECFIYSVSSITGTAQAIVCAQGQNTRIERSNVSHIVGSTSAYGMAFNAGTGTYIKDCKMHDLRTFNFGFLGVFGLSLQEEQQYVVSGCIIESITAFGNSAAFASIGSKYGLFEACSAADLTVLQSGTAAFGFLISTFGVPSIGIKLRDVTAQKIRQTDNGQAAGIAVFGTCEDVCLDQCVAQEIIADGQAFGISYTNVSKITMTDCLSIGIEATNHAAGTYFSDVSCADISGCSNSGIFGTGSIAAGFNITNTRQSLFSDCSSNCVSGENVLVGGFLIQNSSLLTLRACDSMYNSNRDGSNITAGFNLENCHDVLLDFCLTQSNVSEISLGGVGYGFNIQESDNITMLNCTSVMNHDSAFYVDGLSNACFIRNSVGVNSGQGFIDLVQTSTFIENLAAFNGAKMSIYDNYFGVPENIIGEPGDPVVVGGNISA